MLSFFALSPEDWQALRLTAALAGFTTLFSLLIALPLAWWLAYAKRFLYLRLALQALIALPLVLPPTVLGFYFLLFLGPRGHLGSFLEAIGLTHLAFTFEGIVIASVVYSLPFAVQPLQQAFESIGKMPLEIAETLGAGFWDRFFTVLLPLSQGGLLVAGTLTFAHTVGEFGVILMLGGNIPGETKVLSILIYDHAEALNYAAAQRLSLLMLIFSFVVLFMVYSVNRHFQTVKL